MALSDKLLKEKVVFHVLFLKQVFLDQLKVLNCSVIVDVLVN